MRILVCGGRNFANSLKLDKALDAVNAKHGIECIIHGAARGADSMAGEWARSRNIPIEEYPADWVKNGRAAGPIRNQEMLERGCPDAVVAFAGGNGTADMVRRAKEKGLPVWEIPS